MSKQIKCTVCKCNVGEIRDAKLMVGLRYICQHCDLRRTDLMVELYKLKKNKSTDIPDFLKDIFGKKYG